MVDVPSMTPGGGIGRALGDRLSLSVGLLLSSVGTGAGAYAGRRWLGTYR